MAGIDVTGQYAWFYPKERAFLSVLNRNFNILVRHVKDHLPQYQCYIEKAREAYHRAGGDRPQVRVILVVASDLALALDPDMQALLASCDAETPPSRPKTLTDTLSHLDLQVSPYDKISQVKRKALFLLMAGLYTKTI